MDMAPKARAAAASPTAARRPVCRAVRDRKAWATVTVGVPLSGHGGVTSVPPAAIRALSISDSSDGGLACRSLGPRCSPGRPFPVSVSGGEADVRAIASCVIAATCPPSATAESSALAIASPERLPASRALLFASSLRLPRIDAKSEVLDMSVNIWPFCMACSALASDDGIGYAVGSTCASVLSGTLV